MRLEINIENCVAYVTYILQFSICITALNYHLTNAVIHNRGMIKKVGENRQEANKSKDSALLDKRGMSHVEMILSFIIFAGFLIFFLAAFPVYKSGKSEAGLSSTMEGILNETRGNIDYFTIILNKTSGECVYLTIPYELNKIIVKNENGIRVKAKLNGNILSLQAGRYYEVYSSDSFDETGFNDLTGCRDISSIGGYGYELGLKRKLDALRFSRIDALRIAYGSDYSSLRNKFDIPPGENFGFILSDSRDNEILRAIKKSGNEETLARDIPVHVYYDNGGDVFGMLNIQTW